jgi:TatD DNase family protein
MFCDAHCHPDALSEVFPPGEDERRRLAVSIVACSCVAEDYKINLSIKEMASTGQYPASHFLMSYAVHPQLAPESPEICRKSLETMYQLLEEGKLSAIGETGFDLFDSRYKASEKLQDELFTRHIEAAYHYELPLIIHARKAMHKLFAYSKKLKQLPAVIFHSFSGSAEDAASLLRHVLNAYFSFGNALLLNHKLAQAAAAVISPEHLLSETDAPWQPLRFQKYSHYVDLEGIVAKMAELKGCDKGELAETIWQNWQKVYL